MPGPHETLPPPIMTEAGGSRDVEAEEDGCVWAEASAHAHNASRTDFIWKSLKKTKIEVHLYGMIFIAQYHWMYSLRTVHGC